MKERRMGRFRVSSMLIRTHPEMVRVLFKGMIVVRAEFLYCDNAIEYTAEGDIFPPIKQGELLPEYLVQVNTKDTPNGCEVTDISFSTLEQRDA